MKIASLGDTTEQTLGGLARELTAKPPNAAGAVDNLSLLLSAAQASGAPKDKVAQAYGAALRISNQSAVVAEYVNTRILSSR